MDRKEMVKQIREQLKKKGITSRQVSVTSKASLYDDVITANIKDLKVSFNTVEEIVNKYYSVERDEFNGEILAGGNTYTRVEFDWDKVQAEKENYLELAKEIVNKYKNTSKNCIETIAIKGDIVIKYFPNPERNYEKSISIYKVTRQEFKKYDSNDYYFSNAFEKIKRYDAQNIESIAEALVYIVNQYEIDFSKEVEEIDETVLEIICIPEEEKAKNTEREKAYQEQIKTSKQVENIQPLKVENIKDKNIKINAIYPSLNKRNTIEEYEKQLSGDYNINKTLICEIITLSNVDYKLFTNNLLCDCNMIAGKGGNGSDYETDKENIWELTELERKEYVRQSYTLGILVQDESKQNQIIFDPQGYNYARYVGLLKEPFKHI